MPSRWALHRGKDIGQAFTSPSKATGRRMGLHMIESTFLGIPHTGHDKTDEWVHKGHHWLEHTADKAGDALDEGANEIVEQAVAAVHAALSMVGTDALRSLLHSLLGLAEHVAPNRSAEIPIIPFTVFTPGIGLSLNIKDNLGHDPKVGRTSAARQGRLHGDAPGAGRRRVCYRAPAERRRQDTRQSGR